LEQVSELLLDILRAGEKDGQLVLEWERQLEILLDWVSAYVSELVLECLLVLLLEFLRALVMGHESARLLALYLGV
jgi:hypothetical protein